MKYVVNGSKVPSGDGILVNLFKQVPLPSGRTIKVFSLAKDEDLSMDSVAAAKQPDTSSKMDFF